MDSETDRSHCHRAERGDERPTAGEFLDAVVEVIGNPDISRIIDCYSGWKGKLAIPTAKRAELCDVRAGAGELLDAIVVRIGNPDVSRTIDGYAVWIFDLAVPTAKRAELPNIHIVRLG